MTKQDRQYESGRVYTVEPRKRGSRETKTTPVKHARPVDGPSDHEFEPGVIKFIHRKGGYGFITREGGQKDVWFHMERIDSDLVSHLREGMEVQVAVVMLKRGPVARAIRI